MEIAFGTTCGMVWRLSIWRVGGWAVLIGNVLIDRSIHVCYPSNRFIPSPFGPFLACLSTSPEETVLAVPQHYLP